MSTPLVSILMVARNAARFIDAAILSARQQSIRDIEIIVVDDGSADTTAEIARTHAQADGRVRLLQGPRAGLSAVRNASLVAATGRYAAILDSDDILHPGHVEWLLESQARYGAEICATNMIEFHAEGAAFSARVFARGKPWRTVRPIAPKLFVERGMIGAPGVALGYLKPLLDMEFLRTHAITYDERLRIGEDFDLVLRAMLAGGRFVYVPQASYYYRKHATSTSHRLDRADVEGLLRATQEYNISADRAIAAQMAARCDNLRATLLHLDTIAEIKAGRLPQALRLLGSNRQARRLTLASLLEALIKRLRIPGAALASAKPAPVAQEEALSDRLRELSQALPATVFSS